MSVMTDSEKSSPCPVTQPVAIVGMGCIFPKASGLKAYWRLVWRGQDAIGPVPPTHWSAADYYDPDPRRPDHVHCQRGGFIDPVDFDPTEFGIPPAVIEATDTSQLLSLVAARMALQDAGYGPGQRSFDRERTGVVLGVTGTQELVIPLGARLGHPHWRRAMIEAGIDPKSAERAVELIAGSYVGWQEASFPGLLGNVVAGRISNRFDLGGTNCAVDAACASSFAALNLALLELWAGRSDMVLTGGADLLNDIFMHMCFAKTQILSPSGDARPFSSDADGTVLGEGVGIVVLKPLPLAERDGDRIYAVIRGIGASSDGRSNSIYAPRPEGQQRALARAYTHAGIDPDSVELIEAHGTGTRVGDQVEIKALGQIFHRQSRTARCALGSVKSMIGHTKAAAGAAGLIKAALALYYKVLPPTLKIDRPDPGLELDQSPFYLNTAARPWIGRPGSLRRCGVSAFGFGGSNFHLVLEEHASPTALPAWDQTVHLLGLSAANPAGLIDRLVAIGADLGPEPDPETLCRLTRLENQSFDPAAPLRLVGVLENATAAATLDALVAALQAPPSPRTRLPEGWFQGAGPAPGKVAVLFPGQGSQYPQMGRDLACVFPQVRQALEIMADTFGQNPRLEDLIYPPADFSADATEGFTLALQATDRAQPAIGAVSLGWYRVLCDFGLDPDALGGHSFGELAALAAAGWIDAATFTRLAVARGRAMADAGRQEGDPGSMLAVKASLEELENLELPDPDLILANRNAPSQGVFAGPTPAIEKLADICQARGWRAVRLPVAAAFHSRLIDRAQQPFQQAVAEARFSTGHRPVYGNSNALPYPADPGQAAQTLADQMRRPVDFVSMVENLYGDGARIFIEVGPRRVLTGLVRSILGRRQHTALAMDRSNGRGCGIRDLALTLAELCALGVALDLTAWEETPPDPPARRMRIPLCGANHRPPAQAERSCGPKNAETLQQTPETGPDPKVDPPGRAPLPGMAEASATAPSKQEKYIPMDTQDKQPSQPCIEEALQSVRAGLKAIEAMQAQTAQAHEKFLEVQQESVRALVRLMAHTGQLSEPLLEKSALPQSCGASIAGPLDRPEQSASQARSEAAPAAPGAARHENHPAPLAQIRPLQPETPRPPASTSIPPALPPNAGPDRMTDVAAVVAELTGYPTEMLTAEMQIEADLGIDSIKRVEILSSLEERLADLPPLEPEQMAALRTLGDIAAALQPAEAAPQPAARPQEPPPASPSRASGADRMAVVAAVVAQLTGYPTEMLTAEMQIEADLGIDSIKRVEILSALEERLADLPPLEPEQMAALRTLGDIAAALTPVPDAPESVPAATQAPEPAPAPPYSSSMAENQGDLASAAPRNVVHARAFPAEKGKMPALAPDAKVLVAGDPKLAQALAAALTEAGVEAACPEAEVVAGIIAGQPVPFRINGLVWVAPADTAADHAYLKQAFAMARRLAADLGKAAQNGGALLAAVVRLDGAFGFLDAPLAVPSSGALAGLVKTAAREFEAVACRALDIGAGWPDAQSAALALAAELARFNPLDPVEIGLLPGGSRYRLELEPAPYTSAELTLEPGEVIVASGGARGVTAESLVALARKVKPVCVLLGRSPEPGPEPQWLAGIEEPAAIQKAILANEMAKTSASPRDLARRAGQIAAQREIRRNLERLASAGAKAFYYSVDVRRSKDLARILDRVRTEHGPIRALLHGAGTLCDRRIADKTDQQFDAVFDTKVEGFFNLMEAVAQDPLRYVVIFSSVAARMGNPGQVDYAMANELLNKAAGDLARRRPETRVLSINWGPWNGGMVDAGLKRHFEGQGVRLLEPLAGASAMVQTMADGCNGAVEMVVGSALIEDPACDPSEMPTDGFQLAFAHEIDLDSHPVLADHVLGGRPVVPLALMMEWLGHTALHANPGLNLVAMEELRLLNGIKIDGHPHPVRLMNGPSVRREGLFEVPVALFNGNGCNGSGRVHSRARAILADGWPSPPPAAPPLLDLEPFPLSVAEAYGQVLFHGERLHGIRHIDGCSQRGMVARLAPAPAPGRWIRQPLRSRWVTDPLVLDAAFQMAILWCYARRDAVSLPAYAQSYRQYCRRFPSEGVTAELRVRDVTARRLEADFTFLDNQHRVVAVLSGYQATLDPSLAGAFKQCRAA